MKQMDDPTLWRYVDFTKYVDLVSTGELFFCRSDHVGDPFEGSYPEKYLERRIEEIRSKAKDFATEAAMYVIAGSDYRKYVFLSCWHMSNYESAALWRLYLKSDEGIAIQTTRARLSAALSKNADGVWTVPVKYIDYLNDDPPVPTRMAPFRYKRKSFEHEKELRAIVYAEIEDRNGQRLPPPSDAGIRLKASLSDLIVAVHVAPTAPDWFYSLVERISKSFGVTAPVLRSSLATDQPVFI